jgi:phosphoserine phosphatase
LAVFDLDGTLIKPRSSWRYLHEKLGTWKSAGKNAELFYGGKMMWEEWARKDAGLWAGRHVDKIERIARKCPTVHGAKETVNKLRDAGLDIAIISGGLSVFAECVAEKLGISHVFANRLDSENRVLTGNITNTVTQTNKPEVLQQLLEKLRLRLQQTLAVGDDFTMIPVFRIVGLAIAFNPLDLDVGKSAHMTVNSQSLLDILPYVLPDTAANRDPTQHRYL